MRIKNTHDLNTLLLEISRLHSYTSLGLSLNNEMSLSLLFSGSVDMPVLSVIPPPHVRSTGVRDGWILCNDAVRSVTSILLPSFPTEPPGTGTHASRKSKRRYHPVGVLYSLYFGPTSGLLQREVPCRLLSGISMQRSLV